MWCRAFSIALDRLLRVYFRLISTITSDSNRKFRVPWTNYIKGSIPHFEFTEEFITIKVRTKITIKHKTMMKCEVKSNIKIYKKLGSGLGQPRPRVPLAFVQPCPMSVTPLQVNSLSRDSANQF